MGNSCSSDKVEHKETKDKKDSTVDNLNGNDISKSKINSISRKTIKSKSADSNIEVEATCYAIVENTPDFPGGDEACKKYLSSTIVRPKGTDSISGTVYIEFIVEETGKITNVKVKRGVHPLLDAEVTRVITAMPDWVWPDYSTKHEKTRFTIPIKFTAE
jgi:TonB family protein